MTNLQSNSHPAWLTNGQVNEVKFCASFLFLHPMRCVKGTFFTPDGQVPDEDLIKKEIYNMLRPHITAHLNSITSGLLDVLRMECCSESLPLDLERIHVANGTLYLNGTFSQEKHFCRNRLNVSYQKDAPSPVVWLKFVNELLCEDDIPTLQEYLGYCLIPSTKAQKMLVILGNGGEGKSRIGVVLAKMFGTSAIMNSIEKIETNRFARADLENKLLMIDDDLNTNALPKTNTLKTIVTAETPLDLEKKSIQSYQGQLYSRFLCFGNGELTALNDNSNGFYRRQIVLYTKTPPEDRKDDPFLSDKMIEELEGIFLWCYEGLLRLIQNNYQFTLSDHALKACETLNSSSNSFEAFMTSEGYFELQSDSCASTKALYEVYRQFCDDNLYNKLSEKQFSSALKNHSQKYHLEPTNRIYVTKTRRVRGYIGIKVLV